MSKIRERLAECIGFDWSGGNAEKNWDLHRVSAEEAEELFFREPLVLRSDEAHSKTEKRYYALGKTLRDRKLFVVFAIRKRLIRVISVRDMNQREEVWYGHTEKESS